MPCDNTVHYFTQEFLQLKSSNTQGEVSIQMCRMGPEAAILNWYGHCGANKLGPSGDMLPKENF